MGKRAIAVGAAAAVALAWAGAASPARLPVRVPGEAWRVARPAPARVEPRTVLVRFAHPAAGAAAVRGAGDDPVAQLPGSGVEVVRLQPGDTVARKVAQYSARPDVLYAEPNALVHAAGLGPPDDPRLADQWALTQIHAEAGWALFPGSYLPATPTPKIAIVDTGIDSTAPDLATAVDTADGADCVNPVSVCVAGPALDNDPVSHGTHVAGIAGALADNATGIAGLAFASPLIPVKVLHANEQGTVAAVASGIRWAAAHGARVINLSLSTTAFSATLCDAVTAALGQGALVVAAAGNAASGIGTATPNYPAACPGAVGVAMTDDTDSSPAISNIGFPNVFVSAPGVGILSTLRGGAYGSLTGTSASTAFVSGLAALVLGEHPERTVADVKRVLARTSAKVGGVAYGADPFATCATCTWHPWFGYGRIDALQALTGPPPIVSAVTPGSAAVGAPVTIDGEDLTAASAVDFGGVPSPFTVVSSSEVTTTVPPGAVVGKVAVTTPGGSGSSAAAFGPQPTFSPAHGPSGTLVALAGPAIGGARSVTVNGSGLGFGPVSATRLTARIGDGAATGPLTVTTPAGAYTTGTSFVVDPTIYRFTPASGTVGTVVTVLGKGLGATRTVELGGVAAPFTIVDPGELSVIVPPAAPTGPLTIGIAGGGSATTVASFTVVDAGEPTSPVRFDVASAGELRSRGGGR